MTRRQNGDMSTDKEAVRQEFKQCTDDELEAIVEPRFMFRDSDPGFRARVTLRQRVARELLTERRNPTRYGDPSKIESFGWLRRKAQNR